MKSLESIRIAVLIIAAVGIIGCEVNHRVHHVDTGQEPPTPGIVYSLPKTQFLVSIPVTASISSPGAYFTKQGPPPTRYDEHVKELNQLLQTQLKLEAQAAALGQANPAGTKKASTIFREQLNEITNKKRLPVAQRSNVLQRSIDQIAGTDGLALRPNATGSAPAEITDTHVVIPGHQQEQDVYKKLVTAGIVKDAAMYSQLSQKTYEMRTVKLDELTLSTRAIWDEDQLYLLEWPDNPMQAQTLEAKLSAMGFLTESTSRKRDMTIDVAVKVAEVSATIAGKFVGFGASFKNAEKVEYEGRYAEAMRRIDRILSIRESRRKLIESNNPNGDKESLELRLAKMAEEEQALINYFVITKKLSWNAAYRFVPENDRNWCNTMSMIEVVTKPPSNGNGPIQGLRAVHGSPLQPLAAIPGELTPPTGSYTPQVHALNFTSTRSYGKWEDQSGERDAGFRYRLPGEAEITYIVDAKTPQRWTKQIAQFGIVRALPTSMGTADSAITIGLYEDTGAMKSVKAESTVTLVDQLDAFGTGASTVLDQAAAIRAAKAEPSELDKLKAENALLEERKKNAELKKPKIVTLPGEDDS